MESPRTQSGIISSTVNEILIHQCSFEDNCLEWQDLEQFWDKEKLRLQDVDGQMKPVPSSFEEHFLYDSFFDEPIKKNILENDVLGNRRIKGDDISDVPTTYDVKGFRPQEKIVIGTYVDKQIIPGFRYKVRKNLTEEFLFGGQSKYLESVGLGYGKRLTFEGDSLNENENYFWSDSAAHGYGFAFQTISQEYVFNISDTKTGHTIGSILINNPSLKEDIILSTTIGERGYVEKEIEVQFSCDVILTDNANRQNLFVTDVSIRGKAIVVRDTLSSKAKISQIVPDDFIVDSCVLLHEE